MRRINTALGFLHTLLPTTSLTHHHHHYHTAEHKLPHLTHVLEETRLPYEVEATVPIRLRELEREI